MEACWHQNRVKNRCQLRKADIAKSIEKPKDFNDFLSFWGRSWHQNSIKNQSKIEAQDGSPLGIDFLWILVGFGSQVGVENRAKSDQKSIKKRIEKIMKKRCVLEAPGWGDSSDGTRYRRDPGTP